jgi:hypothetical protein
MFTLICTTNTSCINNYKTSTQNLAIVQNTPTIMQYKNSRKKNPKKAKEVGVEIKSPLN